MVLYLCDSHSHYYITKCRKQKVQPRIMAENFQQQEKLCAYIWIRVKHFYYICSNQFQTYIAGNFWENWKLTLVVLLLLFYVQLGCYAFDSCWFLVFHFLFLFCFVFLAVVCFPVGFWISQRWEIRQYSIWLHFWPLNSLHVILWPSFTLHHLYSNQFKMRNGFYSENSADFYMKI